MAEEKGKISVLTPTYNDSESIEETLQSLLNQTYQNWEWIVINDGSTDDTEEHILRLVNKYKIGGKCRYIYQKNADQLNALIHGLEFADGEFIFALHSDDLLPDNRFFQNCVEVMRSDPETDGLFGDLLLIDENSHITGKQKINEYRCNEEIPALMLLWLGRNLYSDVAFHRASTYKDAVKDNYLIWNMPLWIDLRGDSARMLNYRSVSFPVLKYRVHSGNYINSELGQMNVINGELRTASELMKHYTVPFYRQQYFLFRMMNKLFSGRRFRLKYFCKAEADPYRIISFIVQKRYPKGVECNIFLSSLLGFYKSRSERDLVLPKLQDVKIYYGKDVRLFNTQMLNGKLEPFYVSLLDEIRRGFRRIVVQDEEDLKKIKDIIKFLCIGHTEVTVKK